MFPPDSFNAAAAAVCVYSVLKGRLLLIKKIRAKKASWYLPYYVPDAMLTDRQREGVAEGLNHVLAVDKAQFILIGDGNHVDMRFQALLADPKILKTLSNHNVKQIFIERPKSRQAGLDALRSKTGPAASPWDESHPMKEVDDNRHRLTKELVDHASAEGIQVIAADKDPTIRSKILDASFFVKKCFADFLRDKGLHYLAYECEKSAHQAFAQQRLKDRPVAAYINQSAAEGRRSLIFWGNSHVVSGGENSIKRNLDNCVTLSMGSAVDCETIEQDAFGYFSAPNYVINVDEGRIDRFRYPVRKNPYLSALRESSSTRAQTRTSKAAPPLSRNGTA